MKLHSTLCAERSRDTFFAQQDFLTDLHHTNALLQVGQAPACQGVHETERKDARLHSTCRASFHKMHRRGFCKFHKEWEEPCACIHAHESSPRHQARRQVQIANQTIPSQCNAIHKTIVEQFKVAIVYGKSVKHQPQRVGLSHELTDEDISK